MGVTGMVHLIHYKLHITHHTSHITSHCGYKAVFELQKEYLVKTKLEALDGKFLVLISWCQMKHDIHSSSFMPKVEGKIYWFLEKLKVMAHKMALFWHFCWSIFETTCIHICISLNKNDNTPILHTCLTWCWFCLCSTAGHSVVPH